MADQQQFSGNENYSDISVKLRDIEEKQSIIKDRVLLIGENLIQEKEEIQEDIDSIKAKLSNMEEEIRRLKMTIQMMIDNMNNFTRKNEFDILKRQFEMFQPLEIARISDVKDMLNKTIKNLRTNK